VCNDELLLHFYKVSNVVTCNSNLKYLYFYKYKLIFTFRSVLITTFSHSKETGVMHCPIKVVIASLAKRKLIVKARGIGKGLPQRLHVSDQRGHVVLAEYSLGLISV
jgi:hypothetical protein